MGALRLGNRSAIAAVFFGALAGCAAAAPRTSWLRAESKHVVVYSSTSEEDLRKEVAKLEVFSSFLHWAVRAGPAAEAAGAPRLSIYLVDDQRDLRNSDFGEESFGSYAAGPLDTFVFGISAKRGFVEELPRTYGLLHAFAQHVRAYAPRWMAEGLAGYFGEAAIEAENDENVVDVGPRYRMLYEQPWLPLPVVLGAGTADKADAAVFDAESWLLLRYLRSAPELRQKLEAYLRAVGRGGDPAASMQAATGLTTEELERAMRRYLDENLVKNTPTDGLNQVREQDRETDLVYRRQRDRKAPDVRVTRLPASASDFLVAVQQMKAGIRREDRPAFLADIRAKAARWPGDRLAELALARVETMYGDREAGDALLDRVLAADKNDVEALELRALGLILDAGDDAARRNVGYAKARGYLHRAFAIDPSRYQTLYLYALCASIDLAEPTDETLNAILRAHELAPQVSAITLMTARVLVARHDEEQAAQVLAPLATDPFGGENGEKARALREELASRP